MSKYKLLIPLMPTFSPVFGVEEKGEREGGRDEREKGMGKGEKKVRKRERERETERNRYCSPLLETISQILVHCFWKANS